jgi:predicted Zn finger-like uncharacterized protein
MIIQCRQCRTKFRFDDALMEGDGVWMRCSHCQHVFFQDNPHIVQPGGETMAGEEHAPVQETSFTSGAELPPAGVSISGDDEDAALFLDNVTKAKKGLNEELMLDIEKPAGDVIWEDESALASQSTVEEDEGKKRKSPRKGFWKFLKVALWIILVIVAVPAIIYFFVFPQMGDRLIKIANKYTGIGIQEPSSPEIVTGQIKLQDIRQRILNNYILGPIRVVEGTAVNQADYPVSRIVIKGEIVDAYAVVLGERASYAGNVLTDEELTTQPEENILKKLSLPEGRNNVNDKIIPNGQVPFMIVFTHEPPGVIKTTVMTTGAERLL